MVTNADGLEQVVEPFVTLCFEEYEIHFEKSTRHRANLCLEDAYIVLNDNRSNLHTTIRFYNTEYFFSDGASLVCDKYDKDTGHVTLSLPSSMLGSVMESLRHGSRVKFWWSDVLGTVDFHVSGIPALKAADDK